MYRQTAAGAGHPRQPLGIEIVTADLRHGLPEGDFFGVIVQLPGAGRIVDWSRFVTQAHERGALVAVGADLLALTLITRRVEIEADVAFGSAQRFGVQSIRQPHAGYLAMHAKHARNCRPPGRGARSTPTAHRHTAWRCKTHEQHIRARQGHGDICTAQVLLAVIAAIYASYQHAVGHDRTAARMVGHGGDGGFLRRPAWTSFTTRSSTQCSAGARRAAGSRDAAKARGVNIWLVDSDQRVDLL